MLPPPHSHSLPMTRFFDFRLKHTHTHARTDKHRVIGGQRWSDTFASLPVDMCMRRCVIKNAKCKCSSNMRVRRLDWSSIDSSNEKHIRFCLSHSLLAPRYVVDGNHYRCNRTPRIPGMLHKSSTADRNLKAFACCCRCALATEVSVAKAICIPDVPATDIKLVAPNHVVSLLFLFCLENFSKPIFTNFPAKSGCSSLF